MTENCGNARPTYFFAPSDSGEDGANLLDDILDYVNLFETTYNLEIEINTFIMFDVIKMASRDIRKLQNLDGVDPNEYKLAGAWAVWLVRLRPITRVRILNKPGSDSEDEKLNLFINEMFAVFFAFAQILEEDCKTAKRFGVVDYCKAINTESFENFLKILRYRIVSRHSLELIFQLICEQGLQPAMEEGL